jgi:hypothetical protein
VLAARLISDIEAISLADQEGTETISSYRTLPFFDPGKNIATLGRRVFAGGPAPETVDYVHRTTAEYLGAAWLAHAVRAGLPIGRVAALYLVKKYLPAAATERFSLDRSPLGFASGTRAVVHEFLWHRFVSALYKGITPGMKGWDFDFYFEGLKRGWVPPMIAPTNLPEFIPGLEGIGDQIKATLYDPLDPMPAIKAPPEARP